MKYPILDEMFKGEKPQSAFEIGCAGGPFLLELRENYGDIKVGGMDISLGDLQSACGKFPQYQDNFLLHNLVETPWPLDDKEYDISFSIGVLMYIFEPEKVINEMLRISRKIILAEFHNTELDEYGGLSKVMQMDKIVGLGISRNYASLFKKIGLKAEITTNGAKSIIKCQAS